MTPILLAATLSSSPALAWAWGEEHQLRAWRPATLSWASNIAADVLDESISHEELLNEFAPPPREAWCVEAPAPAPSDCVELDFRVRVWLKDFLGLSPNQPLPPGLPFMPSECQTICTH